jgi:hypothetical protein
MPAETIERVHHALVIATSAIPELVISLSFPLAVGALFFGRTLYTRLVWFTSFLAATVVLGIVRATFIAECVVAALAFTGFAVGAMFLYCVAPICKRLSVGREIFLAALVIIYLVVPKIVLGLFGSAHLLVVGWLLMFSTYSYFVDASKPELGQYLFFLFVDPSLVYPLRAKCTSSSTSPTSKLRIGTGVIAMILGRTIYGYVAGFTWFPANAVAHEPPLAVIWSAPLGLVAIYFIRSGYVSFRIGALHLLGYSCRESYVQPFLATSPRDFWLRWNRHLGAWIQRYVFTPLATNFVRRLRVCAITSQTAIAHVTAIGLTFVVMGLLHDLLHFVGEGSMDLRFTVVFAVALAALLLWEGLAKFFEARKALAQNRAVQRVVVPLRVGLVTGYASMLVALMLQYI